MKSKICRNQVLEAQGYQLGGQKVPFRYQNEPLEDTLGTQDPQNGALGVSVGRQWSQIGARWGHLETIMVVKIDTSVALGSTLGAHQARCTRLGDFRPTLGMILLHFW